jgi:hypothetical protein
MSLSCPQGLHRKTAHQRLAPVLLPTFSRVKSVSLECKRRLNDITEILQDTEFYLATESVLNTIISSRPQTQNPNLGTVYEGGTEDE